jgi:two-component system sensor histidine kinase QseC
VPSIRRRLLLVLAAGFAALLAGTGVYVDGLLSRRLTEEFDVALRAQADALVGLVEEEDGGRIAFDYDEASMPQFERGDRPDYFEIFLESGLPLVRSTRLPADRDLPRIASPGPAFHDVTLPDGRAGRAVQVAFVPAPGEEDEPRSATPAPPVPGLVLVVARDRGRLDVLLARIRWTLGGLGGAAALLAAVLAWRTLAVGLRPVDAIAAQLGRLDAGNLSARVRLDATPRELAPIVDQINGLLARLEESFERERRFAANVAHELRTPIAELRTLSDVGSAWPDDAASIARFFGDVRDVAARMERLVANLLLLARCEAGVEAVERAPVRLRELVLETWSKLTPRAAARRIDLRIDLPPDLVADSDPGKLPILVANLLDNAVSYAREGTAIRCAGRRDGLGFELEVTNAAEPLDPGDLARLTEPFWRKDRARSGGDHAGLGLSLVAALAKLLGLAVELGQDPDGTFRARVRGRRAALSSSQGSTARIPLQEAPS